MATAPDSAVPVPDPLSAEDQRKISPPDWSDEYALKIVASDWAFDETYRVNAHDWRYRNADELYLAWAGQMYWEGTRVPRSSLGQYVVFGQVEAMLPKIVGPVTSTDSYHFQLEQPGDNREENDLIVTAWKEMVSKQLGESHWREEVRRALKAFAIYGNAILEVGFEDYEEEFVSFEGISVPKRTANINHPQMGPMSVVVETEQRIRRKTQKDRKTRPYIRYISPKDFFMDANCETSRCQDAGHVTKRVWMRAEQVKALANVKGFKIPSDEVLAQMSKAKSTSNQDVTKLSAELFRYNMWNPSQDYTSDPSQKRIAVVEYTTPTRKVWWLQGGQTVEHIIYNQPNRYGMINYFSVPYADVPDRWNALSVSDVAEGEQRLQQAIINGRVDELALALHPPMLKRRGVTVPWYQLKRAPGRVTEVENPKEDIIQSEISNVTQQAFVEVAASENRVQKLTGVTDLAALGTPSSGGNSANRTATGVNTQAGATQDRMRYLVENVEDLLIEPVVNAVIKFNRKFLDTKTAANWLQLDARFRKLDPVKVMNARVSVDCKASSKMAGRASFLQTFPMLGQVIFNPELLQLMAQQNQETINTDSVLRTFFDAINYTPREPWIIPMSDAQKQAQSQPPPEVQAKLMAQQAQNQSDQTINQNNLRVKLLDTLMKKGFDAHTKHAELDDKHHQALLDLVTQLEIADKQAKARALGAGGAGSDSSSGE